LTRFDSFLFAAFGKVRAGCVETDNGRRKNGVGKRPFSVLKIENWFSARKPHMGEKKKYL